MTGLCTPLGPGSYLAFLLWALLLVALLSDSQLWLLLIIVLAFGWLNRRAGWQVLARRRFWLFILSIVAPAPFVLGEPNVRWGVLRLSQAGLEAGLWMVVRAVTLTLAFSVSLEVLSVTQMVDLFDALGLRGLGFALGVALNLGSVLRDMVEATYHTLRLRGGRRRPFQSLRLFLITVIANALRYGDDVVKAASARAFDPTAIQWRGNHILEGADKAFIAGLVVLGIGLLLDKTGI